MQTLAFGNTANANLASAENLALRRALAVYDFTSFDPGNPAQMYDISGNGVHATWAAVPTKTSLGVTFNGAVYADVPITGKGVDVTIYGLLSLNVADTNRPLMSNRQKAVSAANGTGVDALCINIRQPGMVVGSASNGTNLSPAGQTTVPANSWFCHAWKVRRSEKTDQAYGEAINLATGESFFTVATDAYSDRAWRIGSSMLADGSTFNPMSTTAKAGGLIFIDGIASRAQDAAAYAYFQDVAAARGITLV